MLDKLWEGGSLLGGKHYIEAAYFVWEVVDRDKVSHGKKCVGVNLIALIIKILLLFCLHMKSIKAGPHKCTSADLLILLLMKNIRLYQLLRFNFSHISREHYACSQIAILCFVFWDYKDNKDSCHYNFKTFMRLRANIVKSVKVTRSGGNDICQRA